MSFYGKCIAFVTLISCSLISHAIIEQKIVFSRNGHTGTQRLHVFIDRAINPSNIRLNLNAQLLKPINYLISDTYTPFFDELKTNDMTNQQFILHAAKALSAHLVVDDLQTNINQYLSKEAVQKNIASQIQRTSTLLTTAAKSHSIPTSNLAFEESIIISEQGLLPACLILPSFKNYLDRITLLNNLSKNPKDIFKDTIDKTKTVCIETIRHLNDKIIHRDGQVIDWLDNQKSNNFSLKQLYDHYEGLFYKLPLHQFGRETKLALLIQALYDTQLNSENKNPCQHVILVCDEHMLENIYPTLDKLGYIYDNKVTIEECIKEKKQQENQARNTQKWYQKLPSLITSISKGTFFAATGFTAYKTYEATKNIVLPAVIIAGAALLNRFLS